jgi:hypothetical protein
MAIPGAAEGVTGLLNYFNPSKSPYYTIGIAACISLYFACDVERPGLWKWLAYPVFLVAFLTFVLALDAKNFLSKEAHAEQLRFARSTCISFAVLTLSFAGRQIAQGPANVSMNNRQTHNFWIVVIICSAQTALFLVTNWALNKEEEGIMEDHNYVQITLLTSAFLIDTSVNLTQGFGDDIQSTQHQTTAYVLGTFWILCVAFWIYKLAKLGIHIDVGRPGSSVLPDRGQVLHTLR